MRRILFIILLGIVGSANAQTLKETIGKKMLIGTALNANHILGKDPKGVELVCQQYNCVVAEDCMKPEEVHPKPSKYHFELADSFIDLAQKNNLTINGHVLVWHSQTPEWFFKDEIGEPKTRESLIRLMKEHIYTVAGHFKGKVIGWDVVNEAFESNGKLRKSPWQQIIGDDYIELAFRFAHEADPNAELYYNDYDMSKPGKVKAVCKMVRDFKKKGIRIDGVGMQSHSGRDYPDFDKYEAAIDSFAALGVKVMISELDMNMLPNPKNFGGAEISQSYMYSDEMNPYRNGITKEGLKLFEQNYMTLFNIYKRHADKISRITFWGVTDADTWLNDWPIKGRWNYPLPFDRNYEAKPIVKKIAKMFK